MELSTWLAFFAASWAISISPGAGAVAAMSAGLNHGFKRGYITTLGLVLGIWTQIAVVGVGLGAVVAASSTAFLAVKWAGVAYLVWLGIQVWRAPPIGLDVSGHAAPRGGVRADFGLQPSCQSLHCSAERIAARSQHMCFERRNAGSMDEQPVHQHRSDQREPSRPPIRR